ncbi:MAG: hypothetical protein H6738_25250 [Alphaproteobacteria bacterium]|nr:hypothetical protein [Alphaproteobacteria bacterium]MCB9700120.1 hypothetical protein [Alphaproteobacteria bacterium]
MTRALAEGRELRCERPVLVGPELPGSAESDMLAVLHENLEAEDLRVAIHRAVSHVDACSPLRIGGPLPGEGGDELKFGMRCLLDGVDSPAEGFVSVVETLRFVQDLGRGAVGTSYAIRGASVAVDLVPRGHELLDQEGWTPAELDDAARVLDLLIADGWAHPRDVAETEFVATTASLYGEAGERVPRLRPRGPCGTHDPLTPAELEQEFQQLVDEVTAFEAACPADASPLDCLRAIPRYPTAYQDPLVAHARVIGLRLHVEQLRTRTCPTAGPWEEWVEVRPSHGGVTVWPVPILQQPPWGRYQDSTRADVPLVELACAPYP